MDLHAFISVAEAAGHLVRIDREVDPYLEVARIAAEHDGRPVLFSRVRGSAFPIVTGVCSDRRYFGLVLGVPPDQVIFRLAEVLAKPQALTPSPSPNLGRGEPASPQDWGAGGAMSQSTLTSSPSPNLGRGEPASPQDWGAGGAMSQSTLTSSPSPDLGRGEPASPQDRGAGGAMSQSTLTSSPSPDLGRGEPASPQDRGAWGAAPCQEIIEPAVDLEAIPFLTHYATDGGAYASAAVAFINDPDTGPNASYHRLLRLDKTRVAARLVERRGTDTAWRKLALSTVEGPGPKGLPVAICIGLPLHVLLAASMAPAPGVDEMTIAQALVLTPMATCANGIRVPAEAEFVLEGRITQQLVAEGPFVDLTGTYDFVRQQPVIEIDRVTHRRDAIYQALLPGRLEHRMLMGMPREPTIYAEVNKVARCRNVHITPGGASWLHAVVQIAKQAPDDGRRAIDAAFRGHGSLKHVVIVDEDVNPFDPHDVEWAIATRFQADRGLVVLTDQPSSSLDPSAHHTPGQKSRTAKLGLDATIHWDTPRGPSDPDAYKRV